MKPPRNFIYNAFVTIVTFKYLVTLVTYMEEKSKVIKVNCDLLDQITKWGNIPEIIKKFLANYDVTQVTLKQNNDFHFLFCVGDRDIPFNVTEVTKPVRIPIEIYNELLKARIHPEESFSSVLFRLITFNQKEEIKKPYLLHVFIVPKEEWFDEKGDFKDFICEEFPGNMMENAIVVGDVEDIKKNSLITEKTEIKVMSCYEELELQEKYFKNWRNKRFPFTVFKRSSETKYICMFPGFAEKYEVEDIILDTIEEDEEADKLGFTYEEYGNYKRAREDWEKKREKVRKMKLTRAANKAKKTAENN